MHENQKTPKWNEFIFTVTSFCTFEGSNVQIVLVFQSHTVHACHHVRVQFNSFNNVIHKAQTDNGKSVKVYNSCRNSYLFIF